MSKTITPRQLAANRRNAQSSTGPRTLEGKAAARFNASATASPRGCTGC